MFESRVKQLCEVDYLCDALLLLVENANASKHNHQILQSYSCDFHIMTIINHLPKSVSNNQINKVLNFSKSKTGGLAQVLEVKAEARVMQKVDTDQRNRVVNGQLGTVRDISVEILLIV